MNRELLKYVVARAGYTVTDMAKKLGIARNTYYKKMNGELSFKYEEICIMIAILGLNETEIMDIFFRKAVDN